MSRFVFERMSTVAARCGTNRGGAPRFAGYAPASFGTAGIAAGKIASGFDPASYAMPSYEEVRLQSRDGVDLVAWWVPGDQPDAPTVVAVHGMGSCRKDPVVLVPAGMLHRNGFAVLLVDLRDMGDSEVLDGRWAGGTQEYLDVLGAWDWLRDRGLPAARIGLMGVSMGGSAVVIAAGEEPGVAAVWEDGGFANLSTALGEQVRRSGFPEIVTTGGMAWAFLSGIDLGAHSPIDAVAKMGTRPLAIVHGLSDVSIPPHHGLDLAAARRQAAGRASPAPWFVPGTAHFEAAFLEPDEYQRRLVAFFSEALGDPRTP